MKKKHTLCLAAVMAAAAFYVRGAEQADGATISPTPCDCEAFIGASITVEGYAYVQNHGPICSWSFVDIGVNGPCTDEPACLPDGDSQCSFSSTAYINCPMDPPQEVASWGPLYVDCSTTPTQSPTVPTIVRGTDELVYWDITCDKCRPE
ncbi:MAG: hypothetical protein GY722_11835 [bacterium]|nr:hypothetical protein [bacterium]